MSIRSSWRRWELSDKPALLATADVLKASANRVVVLGRIVEYGVPLPRILANYIYLGGLGDVSDYLRSDCRAVDLAIVKSLVGKGRDYFSVLDTGCTHDTCPVWLGIDQPLRFDCVNLTADDSRLIVSQFTAQDSSIEILAAYPSSSLCYSTEQSAHVRKSNLILF